MRRLFEQVETEVELAGDTPTRMTLDDLEDEGKVAIRLALEPEEYLDGLSAVTITLDAHQRQKLAAACLRVP